ncbi:hypothetical protein ACFO5R_11415 [Halosolutus amylolyticus]|uniref:DUF5666 domain-containing protein n=1 Tax=Halosolutus amylolyticus TaxID=2932267 RepID=A0ABD5PPH8_9EURY|nr:hypothetical protein [Halosolutus amylolyticus]
MNRRAFVAGTTAVLGGFTAGCLDDPETSDSDGGTGTEDENADESESESEADRGTTEPASVCETFEAILDAIVAEEYDEAASFAPTEYVSELSDENVRQQYETLVVPAERPEYSCDEIGTDEEFTQSIASAIDEDVTIGAGSEFAVDVEGPEGETTIGGFAIELDGTWYGLLRGDTRSTEARAGVVLEFDEDDEEFTIEVTSIGNADYVTLGGAAEEFDAADNYGPTDADDLSRVELGVGDRITVDGTDLTGGDLEGTVTVIAVIEADDIRTQVGRIDVDITNR